MKTLGLIGGMSWESSAEYYKILNRQVKNKLGGFHSCKCILYSVDFNEIEYLQRKGEWGALTEIMIEAAQKLERGGADCIIIGTNTMHLMAEEVQRNINIPLLHIADATAEQILTKKLKKVGLIGTKFTMEQGFYKDRIREKYGIDVIIPGAEGQAFIHSTIYNELVLGIINPESKKEYLKIIRELIHQGAEGIILGCTEIPMLINQDDVEIPVFSTTAIHAEFAVDYILRA